MRTALLIILLVATPLSTISQAANNAQEIEQVKAAVKDLHARAKPRVKVILYNLTEFEGDIALPSDDFFIIE